MHRLIRKKNRDELKVFINENRDVSHRFGKYKTLKQKYEVLEKQKQDYIMAQRQKEVENKLQERELFLNDIQNLNYKQINMMAAKNGEPLFNPNDFIDVRQIDDDDPVLKRFAGSPGKRSPSKLESQGSIGKGSNKDSARPLR